VGLDRGNLASAVSITILLIFLLGSTPLALADGAQRDYVKYVIKLDTIIEGTIVDSENENILVGGASITGVVYSKNFSVNENADANGHFVIVLPSGEDHSYILNISALGYDPKTLPENTIKSGEHVNLGKIRINYHPFDLELGENSGSLMRGWSPHDQEVGSHTGEVTTTWRLYESLGATPADSEEAARYNNVGGWRVEERTETYITGYVYVDTSHWSGWIQYDTWSGEISSSQYSSWPSGWVYTSDTHAINYSKWTTSEPVYTTYYKYNWTKYDKRYVYKRYYLGSYYGTADFTDYRGGSFTSYGYQYVYYYSYNKNVASGTTEYTYYRGSSFTTGSDPYYVYTYTGSYQKQTGTQTRYYGRKDYYYRTWIKSGYYDYNQPIYDTRLVGYDVYRAHYEQPVYRDYRRDYSLDDWGDKQTSVTATPLNGYQGNVRLEVHADEEVQVTLDRDVLGFASPSSATLTMTPYFSTSGSAYSVTVHAYDSNGRPVGSKTYNLSLSTDPKPSSYTWSGYWYTASWDAPFPGEDIGVWDFLDPGDPGYINSRGGYTVYHSSTGDQDTTPGEMTVGPGWNGNKPRHWDGGTVNIWLTSSMAGYFKSHTIAPSSCNPSSPVLLTINVKVTGDWSGLVIMDPGIWGRAVNYPTKTQYHRFSWEYKIVN